MCSGHENSFSKDYRLFYFTLYSLMPSKISSEINCMQQSPLSVG